MSGLSCLTLVLIALSCYVACSSSKAVRNEHQAMKKVDLPNRSSPERYTPAQQIAHDVKLEARQKRSQRDLGEYRDLNGIIEDLEDTTNMVQAAAVPQEFDLENMPPLTYYLLLQKLKQLQSNEPTYRVRTPRLGRSIDFQLLQDAFTANGEGDGVGVGVGGGVELSVPRQFVSRVIKKSVPFKPRLGKRTQVCD